MTIIKKHYHPDDIYAIGSLVYDDVSGKQYMITGASYQNLNFELLAVYQLNENHFRRNNSVKANKSIRSNVAISYDNLKERKTSLVSHIPISFNINYSSNIDLNFRKLIFLILIYDLDFDTNNRPQTAIIKTISNLVDIDGNKHCEIKYLELPLNIFITQNSLCYNIIAFNSSYIGMSKTLQYYNRVEYPNVYNWYGEVASQVSAIYSDPFGEIEILNIYLTNLLEYDWYINEGQIILNNDEWERLQKEFNAVAAYPYIDEAFAESLIPSSVYKYEKFNYYKDMLVKLNISIVFNIEADNDIIIFKHLLEKSVLNGYTGDKEITIKGYTNNKSETDNFDDYALNSYSDELMIINNIHNHLSNNELYLYF